MKPFLLQLPSKIKFIIMITIFVLIPVISLSLPVQAQGDDVPEDETFEAMGYIVSVFFELNQSNHLIGVIEVNGEFEGWSFEINVLTYGTRNSTGQVVHNVFGPTREFLSFLNTTYRVTFPMQPLEQRYSVYMIAEFTWVNFQLESESTDVTIERWFTPKITETIPTGNSSNILIDLLIWSPIIIALLLLIGIVRLVFQKTTLSRDTRSESNFSRRQWILSMTSKYEEREKLWSKHSYDPKGYFPGLHTIFSDQIATIQDKLETINQRLHNVDKQISEYKTQKQTITQHEIYIFLSSHFSKASYNRDSLPEDVNVLEVKEIKSNWRNDDWEQLQQKEIVDIMLRICVHYMKTNSITTDKKLNLQEIRDAETIHQFSDRVRNYITYSKNSNKKLGELLEDKKAEEKMIKALTTIRSKNQTQIESTRSDKDFLETNIDTLQLNHDQLKKEFQWMTVAFPTDIAVKKLEKIVPLMAKDILLLKSYLNSLQE